VTWHCTGYCSAEREAAIEFSIDADATVPFGELTCFAYDLRRDPRKHHPIRPILVGPDGISKKVAVPLLAPLGSQEAFEVLLTYELPGCLQVGMDYYTTTLSFAQERVPRFESHLAFLNGRPAWVRVYERRVDGPIRLVKDLAPVRKLGTSAEYVDAERDVPAASARIYVFNRQAGHKGWN
jgi:hypothetical protein